MPQNRDLVERAFKVHAGVVAEGVHPDWARLEVLNRLDRIAETDPGHVVKEITADAPADFKAGASEKDQGVSPRARATSDALDRRLQERMSAGSYSL